MLFTSLPTTKCGNIPLILLATKESGHSYAWPQFFPGSSNPRLPCIAAVDLKNDTASTKRTVDLWLPTPTLPFQEQPGRRLFIAWSVELTKQGDDFVGWANGPRFQVRTMSQPSRPTGSELGHTSATLRQTSLSGLPTPWTPDSVETGGGVTEIKSINSAVWIGVDSLVYVRCWLPYRAGYQPAALRFYIRGISVEQW